MTIRRSAAALVITASLISIVCKADDSGSLISIDVPATATRVESQIRSEFLVVGYQDGENVVVQGAGFNGSAPWAKDFGKGRLIGLDADEMGETVVVYLVPDLQQKVMSVVLRNGSEVFSHEGEDLIKSSPSGRFFYHQTNRTNSELRDERGHPFALPGELGKHPGHYDFIGRHYLLAVIWNLKEREESQPMPGMLALIRLPAEVMWTRAIPFDELDLPGERLGALDAPVPSHLVNAGEESAAMGEDFLVMGERLHLKRVPHRHRASIEATVRCLGATGEVRWQYPARSDILGIGLVGRSHVIVALRASFLALDAKGGKVVSESPLSAITSVDGDTIVEVSHVTTGEHRAIFNPLTHVKGGQVVEESVIAYLANGGIEYEHLKGFSEVVVVGAKLVGIPKDNLTIATEVPEPAGN